MCTRVLAACSVRASSVRLFVLRAPYSASLGPPTADDPLDARLARFHPSLTHTHDPSDAHSVRRPEGRRLFPPAPAEASETPNPSTITTPKTPLPRVSVIRRRRPVCAPSRARRSYPQPIGARRAPPPLTLYSL